MTETDTRDAMTETDEDDILLFNSAKTKIEVTILVFS